MAETRYQDLSPHDRRDALEVAERNSGQKAHLLEKDVWIVATLGVLFDAPFAGNLIFKGGTSLSKVWHAKQVSSISRGTTPLSVKSARERSLLRTVSSQKMFCQSGKPHGLPSARPQIPSAL